MKTSIFSLKALTFGLVMILSFTCASSLFAAVEDNYVVNQVDNTKIVYSTDATGLYLTPKLKYVYSNLSKSTSTKTTLLWNETQDAWFPYFQITTENQPGVRTLTYATWNAYAQAYSNTTERMVYKLDSNNNATSVQHFIWNNNRWIEN
jgi:hypothetical protein